MREINLSDADVAYIKYATPVRNLVYWEMGNTCTYKCSYCTPPFNAGNLPYHDTQAVQDTLKKLPTSLIIFSGGEPTFHPDFEKIVLEKPDHISIGVVTNASRPLAFWERIASKLSFVILSYHSEFAQLDRFMKVAQLILKERKINGRINVVMIPWMWDECVATYNEFVSAGLNVVAKQLLKSFGNGCKGSVIEYTPEQIEWLSNASHLHNDGGVLVNVYNKDHQVIHFTNATELFVLNQTNFNRWNCHVPEQYLVISSSGNAFNTSCDQKTAVGDIYNGFTFPNEAMVCKQQLCWCYGDIAGTKSAPGYTGDIPNTIIK